MGTLNQPQFMPWPVEDQVMILYSATQGFLDDIPVAQVSRFNDMLRSNLTTDHAEIGQDIAATKVLSDENEAKLRAAIEAFKEIWKSVSGEAAETPSLA